MSLQAHKDKLTVDASKVSSRHLMGAILGLVIALGLAVLTLNRYIKDADEAYQILNAQDWHNVPFAPLSAYIGHLWGCLWGFGWVQMRVLSMILNLTSIGFGGYYVYRTFRSASRAIWLTTVAIILYALTNDHEQKYDWDTFASFSLTLTAVITMCYIARPRTLLIVLAGLAAGVAVMMRLPSVPVVIVPVVAIILANDPHKGRHFAVYFLSLSVTTIGLIIALFGSPQGMVNTIHANVIDAHSSTYIIQITFYSLRIVAMYTLLFGIAFFIIKKSRGLTGGKRVILDVALLIGVTLGVMFITDYTLLFEYPYIGLMIFTLIMGILFGRRQWRHGMSADMAVMLLCGLAAVSGSNRGFNRVIVYPFLPIVFGYIIKEWPAWVRRAEMICFAGCTIVMLTLDVTNIRVYIDGFDKEKYTRYESEKSRGVYFDRCDVEWFEEVVPVIERYKNQSECALHVFSEYVDGFIVEYLTDTSNPVTRHDWGFKTLRTDVPETVQKIITQTQSEPGCSILILLLSPPFDSTATRNFAAFDSVFTRVSSTPHCLVYRKATDY